MEQLPDIFIYVCAALVVPIVVARLVVRAEWRTIRNACLVWYGFLMLVLGGFKSTEGFGWVLIMAMFWSIPAVPVISLVMKVWKRLGESSMDTAAVRAERPIWARFPIARMSPAQWSMTALLLAGIALFAYWQDQRDLNARADILRQYFGLSVDTTFADVRRMSKSSITTPRIEAIVRFSDSQFRAYRDSLDNLRIWTLETARFDASGGRGRTGDHSMARTAVSDPCRQSARGLVYALSERNRAYASRTRALHCTADKAERNATRTPRPDEPALHRTRLLRRGANGWLTARSCSVRSISRPSRYI